jgi:hypothetical protein
MVLGAIAAVAVGAGGVLTTGATSSGTPSSFVPISPCRLIDTRLGPDNVGPRATPLGSAETWAVLVRGPVGQCALPATATGVSLNITVISPSAASFLTVFPPDADRPTAANLNWVARQAPTPNAVTAKLSADGRLGFYNLAGSVDLTVDVVGFYVDAGSTSATDDIQKVQQKQADLSTKVSALGVTVTSLAASVTSLAGSDSSLVTRVSVLEQRPVAGDEITASENSMPVILNAQQSTTVGSVTTTTAGRWWISGTWNVLATCTSGTTYLAFLTIDDVVVRATAVSRVGATAAPTTLAGTTTSSIAAGTHVVKVAAQCAAGSASSIGGLTNGGVINVVVLH